MLINICHFILNGLIQTEKLGNVKLMDFTDDQLMDDFYERFFLNYFKGMSGY